MQVQARLQHKTREERTIDELKAQHVQEARVLQEQLKMVKKQRRAAEQALKEKDERLAKQQSDMKKHEDSMVQMKGLLTEKGVDNHNELLRDLAKQRKVAQEAQDRATVPPFKTLVLIIYQGSLKTLWGLNVWCSVLQEIESSAEYIKKQHEKALLAEKKKTAEALRKVIYLMDTVQDLNHRLMVSTRQQTLHSFIIVSRFVQTLICWFFFRSRKWSRETWTFGHEQKTQNHPTDANLHLLLSLLHSAAYYPYFLKPLRITYISLYQDF